jgi:thiol-disulfide isomerase/thioredoxin
MIKAKSSGSKLVSSFVQFNSFIQKLTGTYILGLFPNEHDNLYKVYDQFSSKYPEDFGLFHSFDTNAFIPLLEKYADHKIGVPSIFVFHHKMVAVKDEPIFKVFQQIDTAATTVQELEDFVFKDSLPLIGHLSVGNHLLFYESIKPICYLFYDVDIELRSHIIYLRDKVSKFAKQFNGQIKFVMANETENDQLHKHFFLDKIDTATQLACVDSNNKLFIYKSDQDDDEDDFNSESIETFLNQFLKGQLRPYLRSQVPPKDNSKKLIKVIVGKTFESFVNDPKRNVLIAFYGKHCPDCEPFLGVFKKLAKTYQKYKNLSFAKIDISNNDFPEQFYKFEKPITEPVLYFVGEKNKIDPIRFQNGKFTSYDDLEQFVEQNYDKSTIHQEL